MRKYDWVKLRRKFITGDYKSLKDFADKEDLPYTLVRQNAKGWLEDKRTAKEHKENRIAEKTLEKQISNACDINNTHLELFGKANELIGLLFEQSTLKGVVNAYQLEKAVDCLRKVQKGQRLALGMDKDGGNQAAEENVAQAFEDMRRAFLDESKGT